MRNKLRLFFLRQALIIVVKKPAPSRVPMTGDKAKKNDCYFTTLDDPREEASGILVEDINGDEVKVKVWDVASKKYSGYKKYELSKLLGRRFYAEQFLKGHHFIYKNPVKFVVWNVLKFPMLIIYRDKLSIALYNSKTHRRTERIEILKTIVGLRLDQQARKPTEFSMLFLLTQKYGAWILRHPQYQDLKSHMQMILESLVDSNDVEKNQNGYLAKGKALTTIAYYEEENRRHKEQMKLSRWMVFLTLVIAFSTAYQIFCSGSK